MLIYVWYVVCLLFYAIGGFLFLYLFFLLSCRARKHRSERDDLFHYQLAVRLIPLNACYSAQSFYCF